MPETPYCSLDSLNLDQPIFGTASPHKTLWLLLEYPRPWAARATENNELPEAVKTQLAIWLEAFSDARLVLIKKKNVKTRRRRFFVAVTGETDRRLYRFLLDDVGDLTRIDLKKLIENDGRYDPQLIWKPLYLVCTNGRRDRCCAKFGLPVYDRLDQLLIGEQVPGSEERVWRCTHIGGHRYAPVVAALPAGLTVRLSHSEPALHNFLDHLERGRLWLPGYRGRSCYSPSAQAAEYFLRQQTGRLAVDAFHLINEREDPGKNEFEVVFGEKSGVRHRITLRATQTEPLLASCGTPKFKPQPHFELLDCVETP